MPATLLDEVLSPANLRQAWEEVAENRGMAGVDEVSIRRWRRNWEERLVRLAKDVRSNRYKPGRLRRRRIPKREAGQWRILRIPTVTDRILQRAVLEVLYPVFEARFLDCSFGYRPGRGLENAVERLLVLRENGFRYVLDADIDDFFNRVVHAKLIDFWQEDLPDSSLDSLLEAWLAAGGAQAHLELGIPMGSPLSPLLANITLHRLDCAVIQDGFQMVRYADDFLVLASSATATQRAYPRVEEHLQALGLRYEPRKTRLTSFDEGFEFVGVWFEGDSYEYEWENKRIVVDGDEVDWLFSRYGPDYR